MYRGTTPTEVYKINNADVDLSECKQIWVTIVDWSTKEYTWDIDRLTIDAGEHTVSLTLTQTETLKFVPGQAFTQLRFLYNDDSAFASKRIGLNIEDVRKDGVIE